MSFLNGNCCLKLNYLICGSKDFSSKKKRIDLRKKPIVHNIRSNTKNDLSQITFYQQHNINVKSLEQQNCPLKLSKYNKNIETIKNSDYSSSLNSTIDQSYSTLNNQIVIKDVILHRNYQNQRLGLTLCYEIKSKSITNIYIEQIDKNSIADYQGELQCGDQIIKINNYRVQNRDEAIYLVNKSSTIIFRIIRFKVKQNLSIVDSTITEDDSGVILGCNTDFEINRKKCNSLSSVLSNNLSFKKIEFRRCLSLNDLKNCSFLNQEIDYSIKDLIHSQSLFKITTDNEQFILKPLPFNYQNNISNLNYYPQQLITKNYQIKQKKYSNKQQRKKYFQKSKIFNQINKFNSIQEDFYLLNRIFLRENQQELKDKPYLAIKYQQQSNIENDKLNKIIQKYPHYHFKPKSTTTSNTSTIMI